MSVWLVLRPNFPGSHLVTFQLALVRGNKSIKSKVAMCDSRFDLTDTVQPLKTYNGLKL